MLFAKIYPEVMNANAHQDFPATHSADVKNVQEDHALANLPMFKLEISADWPDVQAVRIANRKRLSVSKLPEELVTVLAHPVTRLPVPANVSTSMNVPTVWDRLAPTEPNVPTRKGLSHVPVLVVQPVTPIMAFAKLCAYPVPATVNVVKTKNA